MYLSSEKFGLIEGGFKMAKHYRHDGHTKLYRLPKPPPAGA